MFKRLINAILIDVSAVADHLFSIEQNWGLNPSKTFWLPLALTDPALLSSVLCSVDQFRARIYYGKECPSAIRHLKQAVCLLNERFRNSALHVSNSTIAAVAGLALTEVGCLNFLETS